MRTADIPQGKTKHLSTCTAAVVEDGMAVAQMFEQVHFSEMDQDPGKVQMSPKVSWPKAN